MAENVPGAALAQAEFYLCLARAFATPDAPDHAPAMRHWLADDLAELASELDLAVAPALADFRREAAVLADRDAWLQVYSAIFLAPPAAARINTAYYLDGAINGGTVRDMEQAYLRCGLARAEGFHDLADHVSVQLEFVALLLANESAPVNAGEFLHRYAGHWIHPLCADLQAAAGAKALPANPYLPLAAVLREAVARHAVAPAADARAERRRRAIEGARGRSSDRGITAADLAEIRRKLEACGLSTDHVPLSADAAQRGLQPGSGALRG